MDSNFDLSKYLFHNLYTHTHIYIRLWPGSATLAMDVKRQIATSTATDLMPLGTRSGRENQVPIGRITRSRLGNAQRTMIQDTPGHRCTCGKLFTTERGMKIHRTKMKCLREGNADQNRTGAPDKSNEVTRSVANHNASDFILDSSDSDLIQFLYGRRPRIAFPSPLSNEWNELDDKLDSLIKKALKDKMEEDMMEIFTDTVYHHCVKRFGIKKPREKVMAKRNRRQREMENLRREKNILRKQYKNSPETERIGLDVIWKDLCARHSALSKAERTRKRKLKQRQTRRRFLQNPYQYGKQLFEQQRSGDLKVSQEELESHLTNTYADHWKGKELDEISGLIWPGEPGVQMKTHPPSQEEIESVIKKARSKSAPGPNGIPYLLYKKCPKVRKILFKILLSKWMLNEVSDQWCKAEGVYIPKEKNAKDINQFRPISLLNVEGKIFFTIVAKRLTEYLLENGYINTEIQKGGIPGMPGCLEHAGMIWESIQKAKSNKLDLSVIWLDLANAYGSVPHKLIWQALEMFHVPQSIQDMLKSYFGQFEMRFSTKDFDTKWIELQTGIAMGCSVSPILFVMAIQILLDGTKAYVKEADLGDGLKMNPLKAFMDDTTIITNTEENAQATLQRLDELIEWSRMKFKPKKSRSLTLSKGKISTEAIFVIGNQRIPTVSQEPVKSLGRWYDASLKDTKRAEETEEILVTGLKLIDKCGLSGKFKLWIFQFILMQKLLWPLLMYEIASSRVEKLEATISKYTRKWLGLPKCLSDVALYCRQAKLALPLRSITEEYKVGKARLVLMYQNSRDNAVKSTEPSVRTGRKWSPKETTQDAVDMLKLKEVMGHTQHDRKGFGTNVKLKFSQVTAKEARDMVLTEIRDNEDNKRVQKAVQQPQQGQWTTWEDAVQRSLTWQEIWNMAPLKLSFILRATYDLLPTRANLKRWYNESDKCPLCGGYETLKHILNGCTVALSSGRYTWRHNRVLQCLTEVLLSATKPPEASTETTKKSFFLQEGTKKVSQIEANAERPGMLDGINDWKVCADLPNQNSYPPEIKRTKERPDLVVYSRSAKTFILIELTVPHEDNIEEQHEYKIAKYERLRTELSKNGYTVRFFAVEVGSRGFLASSMYTLLRQLSLKPKAMNKAVRNIRNITENSSCWIWQRRNDLDWISI